MHFNQNLLHKEIVHEDLTREHDNSVEHSSNSELSSLKHFRIMKKKKTVSDVISLIMGDLANKDVGSNGQCRVCGKLFEYNSGKKGHICSVTCLYRCCTCGKTFHSNQDLKNHTGEHDAPSRPRTKPIARDVKQPNRFKNAQLLKKTYNCDLCFESFSLKWQLMSHLSVHSNIKEYKCDVCAKSFDRKRSLNNHVLTHLIAKV